MSSGQHSIARKWNEVLLEAIRNDFARPTVHARNLFHISAAMYDAWAMYDDDARPYFVGNSIHGVEMELKDFPIPSDIQSAQEEAMSYACYRLLHHRFKDSPDFELTVALIDSLFGSFGFDPNFTSEDYENGSSAALGNYIASGIIDFGLTDGSLEQFDYINIEYYPVNPPLLPTREGSQGLEDPNRWQPLAFDVFIDQSGNEIPGLIPEFLSPEWGNVVPFSLKTTELTLHQKDGINWKVFYDPGQPAYLDVDDPEGSEHYIWNHELVALWSSHLDPGDGIIWDISPSGIGNLDVSGFPGTFEEFQLFYSEEDGGDGSPGREVNPITGLAYEPQLVPRGDYARVLAEFWADGPDSETPPGHWFTILNYVSDHPSNQKRFKGEGDVLSDLEWDIKSYFVLGGAMHDAAVAAWSVKGYYDYVRPISAIRYMADKGQSSDPSLANYDPWGLKLVDGLVEIVEVGDELSGDNNENVGKIKLYAWKGPDYIQDETTDVAGVGWILAENWWPYQRPTFVTPPFAGYVSGHSTFSRAAAEVLTLITGDEYFPGGIGEFLAKKNEFLVFEEGPSQDVILQWATYRDASDQCSLSRIWGGIHPPVDDIPGRLMGEMIGKDAFDHALNFIEGTNEILGNKFNGTGISLFPNPALDYVIIEFPYEMIVKNIELFDLKAQQFYHVKWYAMNGNRINMSVINLLPSLYLLKIQTKDKTYTRKILIR